MNPNPYSKIHNPKSKIKNLRNRRIYIYIYIFKLHLHSATYLLTYLPTQPSHITHHTINNPHPPFPSSLPPASPLTKVTISISTSTSISTSISDTHTSQKGYLKNLLLLPLLIKLDKTSISNLTSNKPHQLSLLEMTFLLPFSFLSFPSINTLRFCVRLFFAVMYVLYSVCRYVLCPHTFILNLLSLR